MASGMVPIDMLEDQEIGKDEIMVYLAVSAMSSREGVPFDAVAIAGMARVSYFDTTAALMTLFASGRLNAFDGRIRLGALGGEVR